MPSTSQGPKKSRMSSSKGPRTKLGYDTCHYHFVFYVRINSVTWCIQHFCWGTQHVGWNGKNVLHPNNINKATVSSIQHVHPSSSSSNGLLLPLHVVFLFLRRFVFLFLRCFLFVFLFLRRFFFLSPFVFVVVPCGSSSSSPTKNDIFLEKSHTDHRSIWPIRIADLYGFSFVEYFFFNFSSSKFVFLEIFYLSIII